MIGSIPASAAKRALASGVVGTVAMLLPACGHNPARAHSPSRPGPAGSLYAALPHGVMGPTRACALVVRRSPRGFFTAVKRVHLVLTSYSRGEPAESQGDISSGMPPATLVWVVEVHARAVHWNHSTPAVAGPPAASRPAKPITDYSVVMNARTGRVTDAGECTCWPLPLWKVGTVVSLTARC